ncbi:maleylpyruvate isomerase family mycothiol-dependent enzyme [Actinoplanes sp. NPDC023936]|uniref:maleylpyruvate isomerase family mycothiol-dependent enzyme n=1 Tax=Actinoplanes sp. NPDC023936 TaxID=3154910 RepID=UPI0033EC26AB
MNQDESWDAIAERRLAVAGLLAELTPAEWEKPSLCDGWRVRDVAAHLAMAPQPPGPLAMAAAAIRAGGRFHTMNHDLAVRWADRPAADLVAELRRHAGSRLLPPVTNYRNTLFDVTVHAQDIAIPLGRPLPTPPETATAAATRVWEMGWPFWARRRFRGVRLIATDAGFAVGAGAERRAPIETLLLLMTGRRVSAQGFGYAAPR